MHFHPILLVKADNLEDAKSMASGFCDCECGDHSIFDYGDIVPDNNTEWNKPLKEVKEKLPADGHIEEAKRLLAKASLELEKKDYVMAEYFYEKAGELFSQSFCTEHLVYNIQFYDYSQDYGDGWYAIEADLHF